MIFHLYVKQIIYTHTLIYIYIYCMYCIKYMRTCMSAMAPYLTSASRLGNTLYSVFFKGASKVIMLQSN